METATRPSGPTWTCPSWLTARFIADARFARAYDSIGDQRRALLKGLIADHFALAQPVPALRAQCTQELASGLTRHVRTSPRPFVLLLTDASLDAPALLLAALMPALCSSAAEVLVLRLGPRQALPDVLLTACELAGQERVAALGPTLALRLLSECAQSGLPGLVLYPDSPDLRRVLARPALRAELDASPLRLAPLRLPRALGLWRDAPAQFDPELVSFLYGEGSFDSGGAGPGSRSRKAPASAEFCAFAAQPRDLLLVPDDRLAAGQGASRLVVGQSRVGLWTWPELCPDLFAVTTQAYTSAPEILL
ncbi:MAG: hypothetical protein CVU73_01010 [Deltaproteobacteria bacterium HGW-Deltaproteobacteria-8]|jgi:hypothetical protein|nr:MAG: hypothetical protein CVU73_01010 [Deltaproteobacteria bacterium HGW-Deltaproteobacteria-8]